MKLSFCRNKAKDLSNNPHQLLAKVVLIQRIGFSKKKKILMNKSSSFLVHLHLLHFVIIKKISIFKRKILLFSKEKSPKPYSKGKFSNEQIFNKNFQNFNGKISKNKSSRKNLQNHIPKEKSPWTDLLKKYSKIQLKNLQNKSSRKSLHKQIFK